MSQNLKPDSNPNSGLLWPHPSHHPVLRKAGIIIALLLAVLLLSVAAPPIDAALGSAQYLPLHNLLEMISIVISMMIFAISLNGFSKKLPVNMVLLGSLFLGVGLLDFSHLLSFQGMPDYVTPSGSEKGIAFWLAARTLAAVALLVATIFSWSVAVSAWQSYLQTGVVLLVVAFVHWVILLHPDSLPRTFTAEQGLTAFKRNYEYAIIACNIAAAIVMWWRMQKPLNFNAAALFAAACVMTLSEMFFTFYAEVTDVYNVLGHVYKVIGFLFVYRAVFVLAIEWPYKQLSSAQARMEATLGALPDLMFEIEEEGYIRSFNSAMPELLALPPDVFINKKVRDVLPPEPAEILMEAIRDAGTTGHSHGKQYQLQLPSGKTNWFELSVARKTTNRQGMRDYVVLARDINLLKENETVLRLQAKRAAALLDLPRIAEQMDEKSFMQRGQEIAEDLTGSEISFIHFVNNGGEEIELVTWSRRTLEHYCTAAYDSHYPLSRAGIWADALRESKPVVFNDYASYPHKHGLPAGHSPLQRLISVPVIEDGRVVMMTGVGNKLTDYTDFDVETVKLISQEIWQIVQRTRTSNKLSRLGRAIDQSNYEVYLLDPKTWLFIDANKGALEKIGYSLQELMRMTPLDLKPELTRESYAAFLAPLSAAKQHNTVFLAQHRCKDGTRYPVEVHLELTDDEPPLLMQVVMDVSERKQAEAALLEAYTRVDRLAQHVPGVIFQFVLRHDGSYSFPYSSQGMKEIYGLLPEQVSKDAEAVFKAIHPDDLQQVKDSMHESARTLTRWHEQYRVNLPDGRTIWVEGDASPEAVADGDVLWYGHIRDITKSKASESLMLQQLQELQRWQRSMLGREERVISIKQEVNELLAKAGQPARYAEQAPLEPGGGDV